MASPAPPDSGCLEGVAAERSLMFWSLLGLGGALIWLAIVLLGAWRVREVFGAEDVRAGSDLPGPDLRGPELPERLDGQNCQEEHSALADVTVLIPARNEAAILPVCLRALASQGERLKIIVIDDQSTDLTFKIARNALAGRVQVVAGSPLPAGWTGKLWALEQGRRMVATRLTLLLDADIELRPGVVGALVEKMRRDKLALASLMAKLRADSFWEKLLMPAFVYFFKLIYPFQRANDPRFPAVAAAAGGCILVETQALAGIGGFAALRGALIDDCTLAALIKAHGFRTWIGLTHEAKSLRGYGALQPIWDMVARNAFTQLRYSIWLLLAVSVLFAAAFLAPPLILLATLCAIAAPGAGAWLALAALALMLHTYRPLLAYYGRSPLWVLAMPLTGTLYLCMTWSSAWRYWRGQRSAWKGRSYNKALDSTAS